MTQLYTTGNILIIIIIRMTQLYTTGNILIIIIIRMTQLYTTGNTKSSIITITTNSLQVFLHKSDYGAISVYGAFAIIVAFFSLLLPIETKGKALKVGYNYVKVNVFW